MKKNEEQKLKILEEFHRRIQNSERWGFPSNWTNKALMECNEKLSHLTKRAADGALVCPICKSSDLVTGLCKVHGVRAQPRR